MKPCKHWIGIDNGVSGSVAVVDGQGALVAYFPTPVEERLDYTKKKAFVKRLRGDALFGLLEPYRDNCVAVIERPMINPTRFKASVSAVRCDEATRIVLELLKIPYRYVDSKEWQKEMLPHQAAVPRAKPGATAEEKKALARKRSQLKRDTKKMSLEVGRRMFPKAEFKGDADAVLIAAWARKQNL